MTNRTIPEGAAEGFRAELQHQEAQAHQAARLLDHARLSVEHDKPGEPLADRAQRLRGAAVVAQQATAELWVTVGWLEGAAAAEQQGILEPSGVRS